MTISFLFVICDFRLFEHSVFFTFACCNWFCTLVFVVVVVSCMSRGGGGGSVKVYYLRMRGYS